MPPPWTCPDCGAALSLLAPIVATVVCTVVVVITWRRGGPLRRWALANREPSLFETR